MKPKIIYLEFLRVICAIVVLLDHICIAGIHIWEDRASTFDKFFYNGVQHWSHFAVPVFLMITGYLLLDPQRVIGYKKAITKYSWRMVVVLLTIGTAFAWMEVYFSTKSLAPSGLLIALWNMIQGDSWKHLWYLYTLVGLYLVVPAIKPIFENLNTKELDALLVIALFFGSIMPTLTSLTGIKLGVTFPLSSIYLFYFMLGRRIGMINNTDNNKNVLLIVIFGILSIVTFICAYFEFYQGSLLLECLTSYTSPIVIAMGCMIFYIAKCVEVKLSRFYSGGAKLIVQHLSVNSFGIYVFHMLWVNVLYKVIKFNPLEYGLWVLLPLLFVLLLLSDITTCIFRKVPCVGKYI